MFNFTSRRIASLTAAAVLLVSACGSAPTPEKTANDAPETPPPATAVAKAAQVDEKAAPAPAGAPAPEPTVAAAATPPPAPAPEPEPVAVNGGWVFKKKLPAVGASALEKESSAMSMNMAITLKGAKTEKLVMVDNTKIERTVEVLAVSADAVTKIKVTYKSYEATKTKNGADEPGKVSLAGKSYIVESAGGTTTVTTPEGGAPPADEVKAVKKQFKSLGRPDSLSKSLPDTPIKVGDRVDSVADGLKDLFKEDQSGKEKVTVSKAAVKLTAVKDTPAGKVGVFEYSFDLAIDVQLMIVKMPAKGVAEIRIRDGAPLHITMKSPLTISGSSVGKVTGTGQADMDMTREMK